MNRARTILSTLAFTAAFALPAFADTHMEGEDAKNRPASEQTASANANASSQTENGTTKDEDQAAKEMMGRIYVYEPVDYKTPTEVIAKLMELGYTDIDDFDVEYNEYEVEATSPSGDDVEITVDAVSGTITDIDDNWF